MSFWKPGETGPGITTDRGSEGDLPPIFDPKLANLPITQQRKQLPILKYYQAILYALETHRTLVIVGETGSGKTTQIPQYLHQAGWTAGGRVVVCTQPRRVAAVTVAARVAEEMGVELGREVAYAVRFDEKQSHEPGVTKIKFCTDGMLMREMLRDPLLSRYGVVMLDEAHERSVYNDVLFGLLKKVMRKRDTLRVIVASATLDAEAFRDFFETNRATEDPSKSTATILSVQGRQHPVDVLYAEQPVGNYVQAAVEAVLNVHENEPAGDVLVFLPGAEDIEAAVEMIRDRVPARPARGQLGLRVLPLYSALPQPMQLAVFQPAPKNTRKVIVATTIAETSVTIDGVRFVIDPGFVKLPFFDPRTGVESLITTYASKASAKQRAGRAGRVSPGKCLRLMTEADFEAVLPEQGVPEMQRVELSWVVLLLKAMGIDDVLHFDFLSPPPANTMIRALELLYALGAMDDRCRLTSPLGESMAEMPVEPRLARTLLAALEDHCAEHMISVAAMLSVQHPFVHPRGSRELKERINEAMAEFAVLEGDHLTYLNVYNGFEEEGGGLGAREWCEENCLNLRTLMRAKEVRGQLRRHMRRLAALRDPSSKGDLGEVEGDEVVRLRKCVVSGYFSNVARLSPDGQYRTIRDRTVVAIHPSSTLSRFGTPPEYIMFHELVHTTQLFARDVSSVDPRWLIQLAPHFYEHKGGPGAAKLAKRRLGPELPSHEMAVLDMEQPWKALRTT